ncbi:MAG: hypothetical protein LBF36_01855 [Mycoplasmataceae bacterium]|jgi:hypothetical protein|nr:hypothetical protein [Mycoplasmataceae bacterium]
MFQSIVNRIKTKKILRKQYFSDLKLLQKKYDKLLAIDEKKHHIVIKEDKKILENKPNYPCFSSELQQLTKDYRSELNRLSTLLKQAKKNRDYQNINNFKLQLKILTRQFKQRKKKLRNKYYLQTLDPIRASYVKERNLLTENYHQKLRCN